MAGTPYAKSVAPLTPGRVYLDPGEVFDKLLPRQGQPIEQPNKISSTLFYMATVIIHDLFRTGDDTKESPNPNYNISSTSSYLDLSPLYGNNVQEQEAVRTMKDSMLKPDTSSEYRVLGFPPGASALLIAFNRFHNYVAGELKRINEGGRFSPNPRLSKVDADRDVDKDLFNTARLFTCGLYVNIILSDYVKPVYPGSGLCGGFTMVRAILSDAITLIKGDRFYTLDWTPATMTDWGFDAIKPNKPQDKLARGGKLHQLLDIAFPELYKDNFVWKLFPFTTPDEMNRILKKQGIVEIYDFSNPI